MAEYDKLIPRYCENATKYGKPVLLEEFGDARSNENQPGAHEAWIDTLSHSQCAGWPAWRLSPQQENDKFPVDDYEQFDVRNDGGPLWNVLKLAMHH